LSIVSVMSGLVAAAAAAYAATRSRAAVERANLAFVWAEPTFERLDGKPAARRLRVRLHSDGPGIALDVRWSIDGPPEVTRAARRRARETVAATATRPVRALRPGEAHPALTIEAPYDDDAVCPSSHRIIHDDPGEEPWWIVVRWSDSAGRRWESGVAMGDELARPARKLRRWSGTWRPWWARLLPEGRSWSEPGRIARRQRQHW
jgi:hypothetical protein